MKAGIHQSMNTKDGNGYEASVRSKLIRSLSKDKKLEPHFSVDLVEKRKQLPVTIVATPGLRPRLTKTKISPDIIIRCSHTTNPVILIGCKKSLRERGAVEERQAIYARLSTDPHISSAPYLLVFEQEHPNHSTKQVQKFADDKMAQFPCLDLVTASPMLDPELWDYVARVLSEYLKSHPHGKNTVVTPSNRNIVPASSTLDFGPLL
jgi:hypothetical protein